MKNPALKKELVVFPLSMGMAVVLAAAIGSWLINPAARADFADFAASLVGLGVFFIVYCAFSFVLYGVVRKPTEKRYASIDQIGSEFPAFNFWFTVLFMFLYAPMFVVFVQQPLISFAGWPSIYDIPYAIGAVLLAFLTYFMASCTYSAVMWRYLRDEAKEKHRFRTLLAWPYKKGWMNLDKLA